MTKAEMRKRAAECLALGWSYQETADDIGVQKGTIVRWMKEPEFVEWKDTLIDAGVEEAKASFRASVAHVARRLYKTVRDTETSDHAFHRAARELRAWLQAGLLETDGEAERNFLLELQAKLEEPTWEAVLTQLQEQGRREMNGSHAEAVEEMA